MSKKIWIINEYAGSPYHGMEYRHYYIAKELIKLGHQPTIISASYSHLLKKYPQKRKEKIDKIDYLWVKVFNYGASHSKGRIIKWFLYTFKILFLPFYLSKPDVILVSPTAPFPVLTSWILAKIYKAKLIYEVKDIWPLSLVELGGFKPTHPFIKMMGAVERFAIKKSDVIVSNLPNYGEHIKKDLGLDRDFVWISNGVDIDELSQVEPLDNSIKSQLPQGKFIVGYTGTIGVANALDSFCEAAKKLKDNNNIAFVLVGDGQEKERLIKQYGYLKNITFINAIPKKQIQSMLAEFNLCFLGWNKEKLYDYGTSANKIFDYMYSGKPILNAFSGKGDVVQIAQCGISVEALNSQAIADGITTLYKMKDEQRKAMGSRGKQYVLEHFTYEKLARRLEKEL